MRKISLFVLCITVLVLTNQAEDEVLSTEAQLLLVRKEWAWKKEKIEGDRDRVLAVMGADRGDGRGPEELRSVFSDRLAMRQFDMKKNEMLLELNILQEKLKKWSNDHGGRYPEGLEGLNLGVEIDIDRYFYFPPDNRLADKESDQLIILASREFIFPGQAGSISITEAIGVTKWITLKEYQQRIESGTPTRIGRVSQQCRPVFGVGYGDGSQALLEKNAGEKVMESDLAIRDRLKLKNPVSGAVGKLLETVDDIYYLEGLTAPPRDQ